MRAFRVALIIGFLSCNPNDSKKSIEKTFTTTSYNQSVLRNVEKYKALENILLTNIDTIIEFRNAQSNAHFNQEDEKFSKFKINETNYSFSLPFDKGHSADEISLKTLPEFIFPKVDSICKALGRNLIYGFTIERLDSSITIGIKTSYDEQSRATSHHQIVSNASWRESHRPDYFVKDTMLTSRLYYQIIVGHDLGR